MRVVIEENDVAATFGCGSSEGFPAGGQGRAGEWDRREAVAVGGGEAGVVVSFYVRGCVGPECLVGRGGGGLLPTGREGIRGGFACHCLLFDGLLVSDFEGRNWR